ncbi:hypothetical protein ACFQPF_12910 [Fictibacillus iocasae]|uniref:DUF3139 domain-containing protein n=1 Tax=Fictibacillus iocasae TaxID=2715437 RepID=A0ABW2NVA7_9BACL
MLKKLGIMIGIVLLLIGSVYGYITYKKNDVKEDVLHFLTSEKKISEENIVTAEPFIANLRGNKNWMVSVKLKDDSRTYYYYKNDKDEIIMESYTEKQVEYPGIN